MRLTMKNHRSNTYRASLIRQDNNCLVGDVVNKLGRYEDICEDLQELEKIVKEHKKKNSQTKVSSDFYLSIRENYFINIISSSPYKGKKNSG